jgi:hypothetical protein
MSKRSPWRFCYCVYFFDDVREDPAELRRSILLFLRGDPTKPSGKLNPNDFSDAATKNLRLSAKVRARIAQFFEQELKACAKELGGRAVRTAVFCLHA